MLEPLEHEDDDERIDDIDQADTVTPEQDVPAAVDDVDTTRTCAVCDRPLEGNRKVTCSADCATEHERARRSRNRKTNGNGKRALLHPPVASGSVAEPAAANDLAAIAALINAGVVVREIHLTLADEPWILSRQ